VEASWIPRKWACPLQKAIRYCPAVALPDGFKKTVLKP